MTAYALPLLEDAIGMTVIFSRLGTTVSIPGIRAFTGGEEEIRTLDPHVANVMLYQLSYFPMC